MEPEFPSEDFLFLLSGWWGQVFFTSLPFTATGTFSPFSPPQKVVCSVQGNTERVGGGLKELHRVLGTPPFLRSHPPL